MVVIIIITYGFIQTPQSIETKKDTIKTIDNFSKDETVSFAFGGDVMLGRYVGDLFQDNNFEELISQFDTTLFKEVDIAWVNLEGPISDKLITQYPSPNNVQFLFSRQAIVGLQKLEVDVVGLANNHTFNDGKDGLQTTKEMLEAADIKWHGHPTKVDESSIYRFQEGDTRVSLIAVHTLYDGSALGIEELILKESEAGYFVIVLPHWGVEYKISHSTRQEELARAWVANGADLIIGTHPHVVEDAQIILKPDGTQGLVLYSLGNFVFDQVFPKETQRGLIVRVDINKKQTKVQMFPVGLKNIRPRYLDDGSEAELIERVCENIASLCDLEKGTITLAG